MNKTFKYLTKAIIQRNQFHWNYLSIQLQTNIYIYVVSEKRSGYNNITYNIIFLCIHIVCTSNHVFLRTWHTCTCKKQVLYFTC